MLVGIKLEDSYYLIFTFTKKTQYWRKDKYKDHWKNTKSRNRPKHT